MTIVCQQESIHSWKIEVAICDLKKINFYKFFVINCIDYICQDIRTITFDKEFDVVLNMADGAIGYLEDDGENHKIFSVIVKALKNGGKPSSDNDIQLMVYSIRE